MKAQINAPVRCPDGCGVVVGGNKNKTIVQLQNKSLVEHPDHAIAVVN